MGAEAVLGQLNTSNAKLQAFPTQMDTALNALSVKINSLLSSIPGWLSDAVGWIVDGVKSLWNKIVHLAQQLYDWLKKNVWPVISGPITLYEASNKWTTDVFHHSSTVSGDVNAAKTSVNDWWQGAAATAYISVIPVQKAASDKISEIAGKVKDTLQTLTFALAAIYIAIAALLAWCLLQIPVITALLTSVIGIPAALVDGVATFLLGLGGVAALFGGSYALAKDALGTFGTLLQLKNDNSAFENGRWPKAENALNEIGNGSDWHFKG